MKTIEEIQRLHAQFEKKFGLSLQGAQQGSDEWFTAKLGVLSASNAHKIVAKTTAETRRTYMAELVAQVATSVFPEVSSKHMEWGKDHEDAARAHYEFVRGVEVTEIPFVFKDSAFRVGCSPDFIWGESGGEIKCPWDSANYIKFLVDGKVKSEWIWQRQFTLWVMGAETWDFCQFDPRMKRNQLHIQTVERDEKKIQTLEDAVPQFIKDMDEMLAKAGFEFGEQWLRLSGKPESEAAG